MTDRIEAGRAATSAHSRISRWRAAFIVYLLALTTGTHWPRLQIQAPVPDTDKFIHFLAFGGLTYLLWRTRWIANLPLLGLIAIAWTGLDEWSQGIPALGRTSSWLDFFAGAIGAIAAVIWIILRNRRAQANS